MALFGQTKDRASTVDRRYRWGNNSLAGSEPWKRRCVFGEGHVIDNVRAYYASCDIGSVLRLAENWLRVLNILCVLTTEITLPSSSFVEDPDKLYVSYPSSLKGIVISEDQLIFY